MTKKTEVRYDDIEGTWHVILILASGNEADVASHCEKEEVQQAAEAIEQWSVA